MTVVGKVDGLVLIPTAMVRTVEKFAMTIKKLMHTISLVELRLLMVVDLSFWWKSRNQL